MLILPTFFVFRAALAVFTFLSFAFFDFELRVLLLPRLHRLSSASFAAAAESTGLTFGAFGLFVDALFLSSIIGFSPRGFTEGSDESRFASDGVIRMENPLAGRGR